MKSCDGPFTKDPEMRCGFGGLTAFPTILKMAEDLAVIYKAEQFFYERSFVNHAMQVL